MDNRIPHTRAVSRYAFFAFCSFGCTVLCAVIFRGIGLEKSLAGNIAFVAGVATFLALRDMTTIPPATKREGA